MSGFIEGAIKAGSKLAASVGEAGAEISAKGFARAFGGAAKMGLKSDTVLAEGVGDLVAADAKAAASNATMNAVERSMEAAGSVEKTAGSAAARATAKEASAALKAAEEAAAKKGASLGTQASEAAGKLGSKAKSALKANSGKIGLAGLGAAAAGVAGLVGAVMAGNTANDLVNKGEEAAAATRDGIIALIDPVLHTALSAMGWSDEKIEDFEKGAANAVMFGGLVVGVYMVHKEFN
jgi:hypothetical protein